jgi:hypothetical protein
MAVDKLFIFVWNCFQRGNIGKRIARETGKEAKPMHGELHERKKKSASKQALLVKENSYF